MPFRNYGPEWELEHFYCMSLALACLVFPQREGGREGEQEPRMTEALPTLTNKPGLLYAQTSVNKFTIPFRASLNNLGCHYMHLTF